jgi:hypothetical protein
MLLAPALLTLSLLQAQSGGKVFLTAEEALKLAFPECTVERGTSYLDEREELRVEELAGSDLAGRVVHPYVARKDGALVGTAYFDVHRVRTKNEVLMLVVAPDGGLARLEVLAFAEPIEYLPKPAFYAQFTGKHLDRELDTKRAIRPVAGATLSVRATTEAARRVLALHRVLGERPVLPQPPR